MFVSNFRRCPLPLKLMSFVLNISKSCTLCPLGQTQLDFLVKSDYTKVICKTHEGNIVLSAFILNLYFI
ncbi:hypothetical protein Hanom_Chr03g00218801 [Helianthus anomalus]